MILNTLVHKQPVSVGLQWAVLNATVVHGYGYKGFPCTLSGAFDNPVITLLRLLRVANSLKIHVRTMFLSYVGSSISKHNSHFFDEQYVLSPECAFGYKFPTAKA